MSASAPLAPGSRLGAYEILGPLKAGGMATLFVGRRLGPAGFVRPVAIKVVHPHLATDRAFVEMFLDEARLSARIQHPNVVHVEELGEEHGSFYLVMEYVHGCSLAQFLRRLGQQGRGMSPAIACYIGMKVADGLHAAHETKNSRGEPLGVVHRDVSPQNVLLSYDGHVKLIDFGVAKSAGRSQETDAGSMKGKLRYMAPEQAWGRDVDRRTDVYALGIVLWETLTHKRLFGASDDFAALEQVRSPVVPPPSQLAAGVSAGLDEAVLVALARDPAARFQTAQAFRRAIGGGCGGATRVEAEDLSALLVTTMQEDIERERLTAPPTLTPVLAVPQPPEARRTGAIRAYTTQIPAVSASDYERMSGQARVAEGETRTTWDPISRVVGPAGPEAGSPPSHGPSLPPAHGASMAPNTMEPSTVGPSRAAYTSAGAIARASDVGSATASVSAPNRASLPGDPPRASARWVLALGMAFGAIFATSLAGAFWVWRATTDVHDTHAALEPSPPATAPASTQGSLVLDAGAAIPTPPTTTAAPMPTGVDVPRPTAARTGTHPPRGATKRPPHEHEPDHQHLATTVTTGSHAPPPTQATGHVPYLDTPSF